MTRDELDGADVETRVLVVSRELKEELVVVVEFNLVLDDKELKLVCEVDEEKTFVEEDEAPVVEFARGNVTEVIEEELVA